MLRVDALIPLGVYLHTPPHWPTGILNVIETIGSLHNLLDRARDRAFFARLTRRIDGLIAASRILRISSRNERGSGHYRGGKGAHHGQRESSS